MSVSGPDRLTDVSLPGYMYKYGFAGLLSGFSDTTPWSMRGRGHDRSFNGALTTLLYDDAIVSTEPQAFLAFLNNHRVPKHVGSQRKASVDR
jgi:hypothetical protein